jgi:hypothetical protein
LLQKCTAHESLCAVFVLADVLVEHRIIYAFEPHEGITTAAALKDGNFDQGMVNETGELLDTQSPTAVRLHSHRIHRRVA